MDDNNGSPPPGCLEVVTTVSESQQCINNINSNRTISSNDDDDTDLDSVDDQQQREEGHQLQSNIDHSQSHKSINSQEEKNDNGYHQDRKKHVVVSRSNVDDSHRCIIGSDKLSSDEDIECAVQLTNTVDLSSYPQSFSAGGSGDDQSKKGEHLLVAELEHDGYAPFSHAASEDDDDDLSSISSRSIALRGRRHPSPSSDENDSDSDDLSDDEDLDDDADDIDGDSDENYEYEFDEDDLTRLNHRRRTGTSGRNVFYVDDDVDNDGTLNPASTLEGMILSIPVSIARNSSTPEKHDEKMGIGLYGVSSPIPYHEITESTSEIKYSKSNDQRNDMVQPLTAKDDVPTYESLMIGEIAGKEAERMKEILYGTFDDASKSWKPMVESTSFLTDQNSESKTSATLFSPESGTKMLYTVPYQTEFMREVQAPFFSNQGGKIGILRNDDTETSYSTIDEQSLTVASEDYQTGRIFDPSPLFVSNVEKIAPLIDQSDLPSRRSKKSKRKKINVNENLSENDVVSNAIDRPLAADPMKSRNVNESESECSYVTSATVDTEKSWQGTDENSLDDIYTKTLPDDDCSVFSEDSRDSIADLGVKRTVRRKKKKKGMTKKQRKKLQPKKRGRKADFQDLDTSTGSNEKINDSLFKIEVDDRIEVIFNNRELLYAEIDERQSIWKTFLTIAAEEAERENKRTAFVKSKAFAQTRSSRTKSRSPSRTERARSLSRVRNGNAETSRRSWSKSRDHLRSRSRSKDPHNTGKEATVSSAKRGKKHILTCTVHELGSKKDNMNENSSKDYAKRSKTTYPSTNMSNHDNQGSDIELTSRQAVDSLLQAHALKKSKGPRRKESISESEPSSNVQDQTFRVDHKEPKVCLETSNMDQKAKDGDLERQSSKVKHDVSSPLDKMKSCSSNSASRKTRPSTTPSSYESTKKVSTKTDELMGYKNSTKKFSDDLLDCLPKKKAKATSQKDKKCLATTTDAKPKSSSAEKAAKLSPLENETTMHHSFPSAFPERDDVTGSYADNRIRLNHQIQEVTARLEDVRSSTQLHILMMKQDVERRHSSFLGQIEHIRTNPFEALKFLNSTRVLSLHSEGRDLRKEIRQLERDISDAVSENRRLTSESQSLNEKSQAVLSNIIRMERDTARHASTLERLRDEHDKFSSILRTGDSVNRSSEDHTFSANMVPSLQDRPYVELGKRLRWHKYE